MAVNLGRESTNNNGVQEATLRSVKQAIDTSVPRSGLSSPKEKALADDVIQQIVTKLNAAETNLGQYLEQLTSKGIDATLARIVNVVKKHGENVEFTDDQIESIKSLLCEAIKSDGKPSETNALSLDELKAFFKARDANEDKEKAELQVVEVEKEVPVEADTDKETEEAEDEEIDGDYSSATPAANFSTLQDFVASQVEMLQETTDQIAEQINSAMAIAANTASPFESLDDKLSGIDANTASLFESLDDKLSGIDANLKDNASSAIDTLESIQPPEPPKIDIPEPVVDENSAAAANVESKISKVESSINSAIEAMKAVIMTPLSAIGSAVSNVTEKVVETVSAPFKAISDKFSGMGAALKEGFKDVMSGVGSALASAAMAPLKAIGGMFAALNPFKKKKKKQKSAEELKLSQMIDKVNNFIDNFFDTMLGHVDQFLDRMLKNAKKIVNKLMSHVFEWILVNAVLLGAILAIVIPMIAQPLMKVLQPMLDFVRDLIFKVLDFLTPIRDNILIPLADFTLKVLKGVFENVLEPFLRGIGNVAEALGQALGKLIIGIADFFVDTLLPFLRDRLVPILASILDIVKELFESIKPWIKPLVDVVFGILVEILGIVKEFFMAIKPWINPLVNEILGTLQTVLSGIKIILSTIVELFKVIAPSVVELGKFLASVFMDVLKGVGWVYEKVVKPIVGAIGQFIEIVMNFGTFLWNKIKSKLPSWLGGGGEDEVDAGDVKSLSEAQGIIKTLQERIEQMQKTDGNAKLQKELQDQLSKTSKIKNGDIMFVFDSLTNMFDFMRTNISAKLDKIMQALNVVDEAETKTVDIEADVKVAAEDFGTLEAKAEEPITLEKLYEDIAIEFIDLRTHFDDVFADTFKAIQHLIEPLAVLFQTTAESFEQIEEPETIDQPAISSTNVIALQTASKTDSNEVVETISQEASAKAAVNDNDNRKSTKSIMAFLARMSSTMQSNFDAILEKMDNKPDLMPMPILAPTNSNNLASMENAI